MIQKSMLFSLTRTYPLDAIEATETIGIACLNIKKEASRIVSRGGRDARKVLSALEIKDLNP